MKTKRQEKILELIKNRIIITQEDLQSELEAMGFNVTQSTVSRDIKELRLVKAHDTDGNYRYISGETPTAPEHTPDHYRELFSKAAKRIDFSLNNIVISCYNGMASSACVAVDAMFGSMMLGSLAGEDTVIIVTHGETESTVLAGELKKLL